MSEGIGAYGTRLTSIFQVRTAPTFINRNLQAGLLAVTEVRDDEPAVRISDPLAAEDAFLATLHLRSFHDSLGWENGVELPRHTMGVGQTLVRDLRRDPTVMIDQPHHSLHFYIPRVGLDLIADDAEARRISDLNYNPGVPIDDPVIRSLGASVLGAFALPEQSNRMFLDHVMIALATHVASTLGGLQPGSRVIRGGLSPWQERRAKEAIDANLSGEVGLGELAEACGVSLSHFRRAFRKTTSMAPHQWLLHRRVELAKSKLLDRRLGLADIALQCGFADQSHFTRVFTRFAGESPGRWRRNSFAPSLPLLLDGLDA